MLVPIEVKIGLLRMGRFVFFTFIFVLLMKYTSMLLRFSGVGEKIVKIDAL